MVLNHENVFCLVDFIVADIVNDIDFQSVSNATIQYLCPTKQVFVSRILNLFQSVMDNREIDLRLILFDY